MTMDKNTTTLKFDYAQLMDLRVDYAFKTFAEGNPDSLISLLNSIFANKKIKRIIKSITIKNPYLDKKSIDDKLSILDVRAELDDGTTVLVEMHMYGLGELKSKTIRSWARAYGEELEVGQSYTAQPPTITIAFTNGTVEPIENIKTVNTNKDKIHRLCMIMDAEDFTVFTNIENACIEEEEIQMAMTALQRQSEDKIIRQAYQRRKDEIYFHKKEIFDYQQRAEQAEIEIERLRKEIEKLRANQRV